jgi:hypothetical protein
VEGEAEMEHPGLRRQDISMKERQGWGRETINDNEN